MGITRISAMIIQTNEVNIDAFEGPEKKYGFIVSRIENGNYRNILSSEPVYETGEQAMAEGDGLVKEIRELDLSKI